LTTCSRSTGFYASNWRGRRLRLTDTQRRRLAVRAKALGRQALAGLACIVAPDTLLRWYAGLVARK
jgi:predicted component of type VI protein secretion system